MSIPVGYRALLEHAREREKAREEYFEYLQRVAAERAIARSNIAVSDPRARKKILEQVITRPALDPLKTVTGAVSGVALQAIVNSYLAQLLKQRFPKLERVSLIAAALAGGLVAGKQPTEKLLS